MDWVWSTLCGSTAVFQLDKLPVPPVRCSISPSDLVIFAGIWLCIMPQQVMDMFFSSRSRGSEKRVIATSAEDAGAPKRSCTEARDTSASPSPSPATDHSGYMTSFTTHTRETPAIFRSRLFHACKWASKEEHPLPATGWLAELREFLLMFNRTPATLHARIPVYHRVIPFIHCSDNARFTITRLDRQSTLTHIPRAIGTEACRALFDELKPGSDCAIQWEQHSMISPIGRTTKLPRLTALLSTSDERVTYDYSGTINVAQRMPPLLSNMIRKIGSDYNAVFANWYVDGATSHIGWHSDDEHGMDQRSGITSLSLGGTRTFQVLSKREGGRIGRTKTQKLAKIAATRLVEVVLREGDLLMMEGSDFQKNWVHRVPKEKSRTSPRLVLTFRNLVASA